MRAFHREKRDQGVRWLRRKGLSEADAHDLASEAFVALVRSIPEDPDGYFWVSLRRLSAEKQRRERCREKPVEWIRKGLHVPGLLPHEELWEKECRERINAILCRVPEGQAKVAWLLLDEWKVPEIAEELGIAASTVRTLRERLRKRLAAQWCDDLNPGDPS